MSTVSKLVVLKLDGNLCEHGFRVTLEISSDMDRPSIEIFGELPPAPDLVTNVSHWQKNYRSLGNQNRLEPIGITLGGSVNKLEICRNSADTLRDRMKAWLNSPSFHPVDRRLREELSVSEAIRFLIRTQDRYLRHLPWHDWDFFERYSKAEFAIGSLSYKQVEVPKKPAITKQKVKILAILGDSTGIDIEKDRSFLESLDENADITFLVEKSRQEINNHLWEQSWDILFFAGHSETKEEQGIIQINSQESLTIDELKYGLRQAITNGLQLAIFNSCDGLGLAYELEQLNLPQLILMRQPVPDQVAQEFLKHFLEAFAGGDSLYLAERKARERLQGLEGKYPCASWLPVICQNPASVPPTWQELVGNGIAVPGVESILPRSPNYPKKKPKLPVILLMSLVIASLLLGLRSYGLYQPMELWAYDKFMQLQPASTINDKLLIVAVNDEDIREFKKPLKDKTITQLLTKLKKYQPRVIGLDIYRDIPQGTKKDWQNLGKEIQNSQIPIIPVCVVGDVLGQFQPLPAIKPPPKVLSENLGFADGLMKDSDGVIRRYSLIMSLRPESPCYTQYSLSFQLVRYYFSSQFKNPLYDHKILRINSKNIKTLKPLSGGYEAQENKMPGHQILINYYPPHQVIQEVSLQDVINGVDSDLVSLIKDRIVLIGYIVTDTKDYHPTPISKMHGVRIHAQVVNQLMNAIENKSPLISYWSQSAEKLWILFWSTVGGLLIWQFRSLKHIIIMIGIGCLTLLLICFHHFIKGIWIPLIPSLLGLIVTSIMIYYFIGIPQLEQLFSRVRHTMSLLRK